MSNWVLSNDQTAVINLDRVASLGVRNTGTNEYKTGVCTSLENWATPIAYLDGTWTTLAAALEAARELTRAADSSSFGD